MEYKKRMPHYGKKLKILRITHDLSQAELGDKLGKVSGRTISYWERSQFPPIESIFAICKFFNLPLPKFFGDVDDEKFQVNAKYQKLITDLESLPEDLSNDLLETFEALLIYKKRDPKGKRSVQENPYRFMGNE